MEILQPETVLPQQETSLWKISNRVLLDKEFAMTQAIIHQQLAIKVINAVLNHLSLQSIKILMLDLLRFIPKLQSDLLIPRHHKLEKRKCQTTLLNFFQPLRL